MCDSDYHPLYLAGIDLFNEREFFECHDIWEELWAGYQGPSRKFYQGLIQVAVSLHHYGNGNVRGARKLYHTSSKYLCEFGSLHEGLNLATFLEQYQACFQTLLDSDEEFPSVELDADLIPEIHLVDEPEEE